MSWTRYTIMLILGVITLYVAYHHYFPKSKFWKFQPVTRKGMKERRAGDIVDEPLSSKHLSIISGCQFEKVEKVSDLVKLLDDNYFEGVKYPSEYLEWELRMGEKEKRGESWFLRDTGKVIGAISEIPLTIWIDGKDKPFMYVDHLTVVKEQRGKGVATKLISKGVQIGVERDVPRFIFRIEQKPLPYPYLCKLSNYYGAVNEKFMGSAEYKKFDGKQNVNERGDESLVYQYWREWIEKHKFAMIMNEKQFVEYAKCSEIVTTWYWMREGNVVGLLIGLKTVFKGDSVTEIVFSHCNESKDDKNIMFSNIHSLDTKWISMHNYSDHMKWIKMLGLKRSHDLYVHLYNYHHPRIEGGDLHFGMG